MKDDRVYLLHVRDAIGRILSYTTEGKQAFLADGKTQDAVVRNLEVIGEAAKRISGDLKSRHADIPWKRMAGMRDKMIHEYFGVDLEIVWAAVERDLPALRVSVNTILKSLGGG